ncbi:anaphase-promoting complex subunit 8 [Ophiostoma piceae UAMH 11346]|uniref:Anaphase-promoting complex subunit 8 n=1 Tax=Ophiostoma piceae (strain UAMH 11346) TaxID=1262450 RepID=S3CGG5_OPHP1|nr:anaphase-promoting complex subunit 8 [Ophiostoma piceae UAMH 11346]
MGLTKQETQQLRSALQDAVVKCSERCLYQSAKWAAELLTSIPESAAGGDSLSASVPVIVTQNVDLNEARLEAAEINKYLLAKSFFDCREYDRCAAVFLPDSLMSGVLATHRQDHDDVTQGSGEYEYASAAASFRGSRLGSKDTLSSKKEKEAGKAAAPPTAHTTTSATSPLHADPVHALPELSQRSLFLALYAKLISGEKKKDEEVEMVMGPHDTGDVVNRQLRVISAYLQTWFDQNLGEDGELEGMGGEVDGAQRPGTGVISQGWLEYLYGMVLAKEKNEREAMEWFIRSVHRFPMNWGCWLEMTALISRVDELNKIAPRLPQNIVSFIFHLHASLELYQQGHNLANSVDQLLGIFPTSSFLLTCSAMLAYHSKDLIAAEQHFSMLLAQHPHRLDSLDHYSNILYVLNLRPKLAFLAHLCSSLDKFRAETCVVIGNYYSLMSAHEKAVQYFRRALALDRSCLSAWTLMGHEYVELKNTHAAIESYRRAVDVNRRDYRAWYGLGQTYEVLESHTYALFYYKKAAGLRPWDGKMWMAVGSCLQKISRPRDGIKALKRALLADSSYESSGSFSGGAGGKSGYMDPEVLLQIALMYDQLQEYDEAKSYMELCMAQEEGESDGNFGESVRRESMAGGGLDDDDDEDNTGAGDGAGGRAGGGGGGGGGGGTGVTPATSKARLWLARAALENEEYTTAVALAQELCQDGVDVEEAKALVKKGEEGVAKSSKARRSLQQLNT